MMGHQHENMAHTAHSIDAVTQIFLSLPFIIGLLLYITAVIFSKRQNKAWPIYRTVLWTAGSVLCIITVVNPLASIAHQNFTMHMFGHLLLGMLGPLFMVLAAPMTLLLRTLPTRYAKKVTAVLRSPFFHFLSNPIVPAVLNIGGLWLLYTTGLYSMMETLMWVHVLVHLHVFLAGYFFAATLLYIDPIPYRYSYIHRSLVLILALAGHKILSKVIYAYPPEGVSRAEAEAGGMLMYYGGDAVDIVIIIILCYQWYQSKRTREVRYPVTG
ncbi:MULTISPECIES: cytochrome c oxidase assembly protein [Oceanobacillus]|uniref:cytochrome c oxidase assembly protein n=1 Tax=Oceanobacillus TaxID=182709 RepID=UPI001D006B05|nr:cytochrome c oxidase assembly protein [Oceanobacillus oncorhynchi]UUI39403.1 cytochrome c oxidase assembly protein [Oceanobacillus oncorhynchi]